jgi:hypothetical protein
VAGFKSESAADFSSEWVADFRRNQQLREVTAGGRFGTLGGAGHGGVLQAEGVVGG